MDGDIRRFQRMYICFAACKNGWMNGCRPIIGLDGCHIKGHHPGQLLAAVGIDANNGMFPIAYAIAEAENQETWTWFLYLLKCDLKIERDSSYTFITDKQKGLGNAIAVLPFVAGLIWTCTYAGWFPNAEHRYCVRHLYNNFKAKHPGEGLKQLDKNPAQWSRAYFKYESRCDLLLNNLCESFNAAIMPARDKPILTMLEKIRMDMMVRQSNRRVACERWKDLVGPRIKKIIDKIGQRATKYRAHRAGEFIFQITGCGEHGSKHAVDLGLHTCTCKRWQLSGIPSVHAVCALRFKKQEVALYCDDYLMPSTYLDAYNPIIYPIAGQEDWEPVDYPIAPPLFKQQPSRPKMKRVKEPGERNQTTAPPAPKEGKLPKTGIKMSCRVCGQQGHNKLGCPIIKAAKAAATGEGSSNGANPSNKRKRTNNKPKRASFPKGCSNLKDQIIRSRKTWKKMKETAGGTSTVNTSASASQSVQQPPTQSSQNPAARGAHKKSSQPIQQSQASSEWAGL
ncbi:uncharacterized protein LOC133716173 [Rosa rugosa]|uniref:uncharacterized protein LOC133716173 n=1 Tax=Rosa rugosa TaxID=74645 RepID=UPI002B40751A|nr:uncharacterized protein LOC133716173 [Rosa rugosa]